jgi:hypothetical protein
MSPQRQVANNKKDNENADEEIQKRKKWKPRTAYASNNSGFTKGSTKPPAYNPGGGQKNGNVTSYSTNL